VSEINNLNFLKIFCYFAVFYVYYLRMSEICTTNSGIRKLNIFYFSKTEVPKQKKKSFVHFSFRISAIEELLILNLKPKLIRDTNL
jgi:hypothetical protein